MAQFVSTAIDIEGKQVKQFTSLSISQYINEHHRFRIVCPSEAIDGTSGVLNTSRNLIGGKITIQIKAIEGAGALQFSGLVTYVESSRHSGHAGDVVISGFSPTVLLDSGAHCKSWEKKAVKNIAQDVLRHFPKNLLQPQIAPVNSETLPYTVQYKETAWQFLNRLACSFGEWFFYDGQKLVLGPPNSSKTTLVYGSSLDQFTMALQVRPAKFRLLAYDYMNSEVYDSAPSGIAAKAGLNDWGKHTLQKSEQFYGSQPKQWHNHFLTNKKQLDDFINTRAAAQSSSMVYFNGSSSHAGLQVGGVVSVQGKNVFNARDEQFGDYTVTSVNHYCDGQGNYSNEFEAIPASIKIPPSIGSGEPHCETQSAFVTDNHDPKGLGRIRVKFHWMNGVEKTPWLRLASPHGGGGKGMFFIPEKGEEVIVGFEGDSAVKPYIIGTVYHGKAKNSYSNPENDLKVIQTRSGHVLEFNDKEGAESITITDKNRNVIVIDTAEDSISITANGAINMSASSIHMVATGAITMNAGAAIEGAAGTMVTFGAGVSTSLVSVRDTVIMAGKMLSASGGKNAKFGSGAGANIELQAKGEATFNSSKKLDITSKQSTMSGSDKATFKSKQTFVEGSSKAVVKGSKVDIS